MPDRVYSRSRVRFQDDAIKILETKISAMEGGVMDAAWDYRDGIASSPRWGLNKAFMIAKAVLAGRQGNLAERRRLMGTMRGVEREFAKSRRKAEEQSRPVTPSIQERTLSAATV